MKTNLYTAATLAFFSATACVNDKGSPELPNILFCISDDQSFPHAGAYGCDWVKTPAFDRVANEGILFHNGYTPNAKCSPSRSIILTGRNSWQLEDAANHGPFFPDKFKTFPEALDESGYFIGYTGKGWGPGNPGVKEGKPRELIGTNYSDIRTEPPAMHISNIDYAANFEVFLDAKPDGEPFFFWYGGYEPHRAYEFMAGVNKGGKQLKDIDKVLPVWPDNDTVRHDMLDYAYEIEWFDLHLERMLAELKKRGMLENTIIVVTSDNGMPFPRIKGQSYKLSNHLPLAIMWPKGIKDPGRHIKDFVSFTDFAPTFFEAAGIHPDDTGMKSMEGRSLIPIFRNERGAKGRDYVLVGKERHDMGRPDDQGYPMRGIVNHEYLYVRNYYPDRWPAGNPETGYMNCDGSPTKSWILNERRRKGESWFWELNFGKRSSEELYHIKTDPHCMDNLVDKPEYSKVKLELVELMTTELKAQEDPRILGNGDIFMSYPNANDVTRDFYTRFMAGEPVMARWIEQSDIEVEDINQNK